MTEDIQKKIKDILKEKKDVKGNSSGFALNRSTIEKVFRTLQVSSAQDIQARLTLIDSMYSTQMNRRYYALEELAQALWTLNQKNGDLAGLFKTFAKDRDISAFNDTDGKNNLWSAQYGIGKDGKEKGVAVSLISKYAYFATGYKFPIYDSIACEMIPLIWPDPESYESVCPWKVHEKPSIREFLDAVNSLCKYYQTDYDHLDRLMWFVGKILRKNFSLVLTRSEYEHLRNMVGGNIDNLSIAALEMEKMQFIADELVREFFELARLLAQENPNLDKPAPRKRAFRKRK